MCEMGSVNLHGWGGLSKVDFGNLQVGGNLLDTPCKLKA